MKMRQQHQREQGAVSLFVVVFATLLMIVITISFIQLMIKDQQQATASDLSQSAYDSAKSGVEDAKRLLLLDQQCRNGTASISPGECTEVAAAIDSGLCNTVSVGLFDRLPDEESEIMIKQDDGDEALQQAYTCVKIQPITEDYKSIVGVNQSNMVPLKGTRAFDSVRISWFTREDISAETNSMAIGFPSTGPNFELPRVSQWEVNYPALLRAQLMQSGASFTLADYDAEKNASTLFLYPGESGTPIADFATVRKDGSQTPEIVDCETSFTGITYACDVTIALPDPADGDAANRNAFLRLSALYNGAHYKIELLDSLGGVVPFDRVQPKVDSTGRANDMFRRIENRIEFKSDFIYPEAALDLQGNLCKSFVITDLDSEYTNACTP